MASKAPGFVDPVMRLGTAARGVVYVVLGWLAVQAAWRGGQAEGTQGAIASMQEGTWGTIVLWAVALGLLFYGIWRGLAAFMDLEEHGDDGKGTVARIGIGVSAVIHVGLAVTAARIAMGDPGSSGGSGNNGDGGSSEGLAATVMQWPGGRWIVFAIGLAVIGAGIYYGYKGISEKYKEKLRNTRMTQRLSPVAKFGLVAHGVGIALIGVFFCYGGYTADPSQAFETVREAAYGRILLVVLGLGFMAFAVFCWIEAIYRFVPARVDDDSDVRSMARAAKLEAEGRIASAT